MLLDPEQKGCRIEAEQPGKKASLAYCGPVGQQQLLALETGTKFIRDMVFPSPLASLSNIEHSTYPPSPPSERKDTQIGGRHFPQLGSFPFLSRNPSLYRKVAGSCQVHISQI